MALFRYASKLKKADEHDYLYKWDFTKSLVDEIGGVTATLVANASRDSNGVHFLHPMDAMNMSPNPINMNGKTIEMDISNFEFVGDSSKNIQVILNARNNDVGAYVYTGLLLKSSGSGSCWQAHGYTDSGSNDGWGYDYKIVDSDLDGHTVKIKCENGNTLSLWIDDELKFDSKSSGWTYFNSSKCNYLRIGGSGYSTHQCYNMTITGIRIYENED